LVIGQKSYNFFLVVKVINEFLLKECMSKAKGSAAERELIHLLHGAEWGIIRSAGSGSTPLPSTDIIAGNGKRFLAIECKSLRYTTKYFYPEEVGQLVFFAKRFGAEPWLGIRFDRIGWFFVKPGDLERSKNGNLNISLEKARVKGLTFEKLIEKEEKWKEKL